MVSEQETSRWAVPICDTRPLWRQCAEHIKGMIEHGVLEPGDPLPSHTELADASGVGASTLQKALSWLSAEGLIVRHRRRGSFVADDAAARTPSWIGVMTRAMFDPNLSQWDMEGARALIDLLADEGVEFRFYHNHYLPSGPDADCQEIAPALLEDVTAGRVRGLLVIGAIPANHPEFRDALKARRIPLVELTSRDMETSFVVEFDRAAFLRRALTLASEQGCRSVGLIDTLGLDQQAPLKDAFEQQLAESDLEFRPGWRIGIDWPASTIKGLTAFERLRARAERLPEALVITDEYAALGVAQACLAGELRVPDALLLITYFTEGAEIVYPLPMLTVQFSPDAIMQQAWAMLKARLDGAIIRRRLIQIPPAKTQAFPGYAIRHQSRQPQPQGSST